MAKATKKSTKKSIAAKKSASGSAPRHAVRVSGKEYGSTFQAFKSLGLPVGRHTRFRKLLKEAGSKVFEFGKRKLTFTIVKPKATKAAA